MQEHAQNISISSQIAWRTPKTPNNNKKPFNLLELFKLKKSLAANLIILRIFLCVLVIFIIHLKFFFWNFWIVAIMQEFFNYCSDSNAGSSLFLAVAQRPDILIYAVFHSSHLMDSLKVLAKLKFVFKLKVSRDFNSKSNKCF